MTWPVCSAGWNVVSNRAVEKLTLVSMNQVKIPAYDPQESPL